MSGVAACDVLLIRDADLGCGVTFVCAASRCFFCFSADLPAFRFLFCVSFASSSATVASSAATLMRSLLFSSA